jgi:uncharacterized protein YdaU (DUF1376 family)
MSSKLGYTFYPKDFISDPDVMMMSPSQRGIYRDLIDLAYMNDNCIKYSLIQLAKYTNSTEDEVEEILLLKAEKRGDYWSIPSCDKRITKALTNRHNGAKGGRPKKPKQNPNGNPNKTQTQRQREREREREYKIENKDEGELKEKKIINNNSFFETSLNSPQWIESVCMTQGLKPEKLKIKLEEFKNHLISIGEQKSGIRDFKSHFINWLSKNKTYAQPANGITKNR